MTPAIAPDAPTIGVLGCAITPDADQAELAIAIERASHLPADSARPADRALWSATNGLRVFGWTHGFTLPYALQTLDDLALKSPPVLRKPKSTR